MLLSLSTLPLLLIGEAYSLRNDHWIIRQRSFELLRYCEEISLPAIIYASNSKDIEQRNCGNRLLSRLSSRWSDRCITILAWWMFYGPNQYKDEKLLRYLDTKWCDTVQAWPEWLHLRLAEKAWQWKLLGDEVVLFDGTTHKAGWINVMRFRARKLPDPI